MTGLFFGAVSFLLIIFARQKETAFPVGIAVLNYLFSMFCN